jgi:hypothetical protein
MSAHRFELTNYSSPVSVRVGQEFDILMTTEYVPRPGQHVSCQRDTCFEMLNNLFEIPMTGPESLPYTTGSFSFKPLKFEGEMVRSAPWHTDHDPPKPLWRIKFYLIVDGQKVATAEASIKIEN